MLEQLSQIDYSQIFSILFFVGFIFNIFLAFVIIFFERRQARLYVGMATRTIFLTYRRIHTLSIVRSSNQSSDYIHFK